MNDDVGLLGLEEIVFRYSARGRIVAPNGSIFICPLGGGRLRFLHKLYQVKNRERCEDLQSLLGFEPPQDYLEFMSRCNGVILFDNTLSIYGIVFELNRSLRLEDQQPISLLHELESSRWRHGPEYLWRPVGSVAGHDKLFELDINSLGQVKIQCGDGPARIFKSFGNAMLRLAIFLDGLSNEYGFLDQSNESMDAELSRFVTSDPVPRQPEHEA